MKKKIFCTTLALLATPFLVTAQNTTGDLRGFIIVVGGIVNILVPLVSTLAVVFFFYGLAKYVLNAGDEEKKEEGKNIMIWGVLAMFVLVTIWGIIGFLQRTVGNTGGPTNINIDIPDITPSSVGGSPFPTSVGGNPFLI